jgi:serine protease inhibitor
MKLSNILTSLFLVATFVACDWFENNKQPTDIVLDEKSTQLVESNNTFGFDLFETIVAGEEVNKNIMVSPFSVSQALSMATNGAKENTFTQMQQVLGFEGFTLPEMNDCNNKVVNSLLDHDSKVKIEIANSIWYRNNFTVKAGFIGDNKSFYNAEVSSYDQSQPGKAKEAINKWVDDKTNGKIDKIIDQVNADDVMFLINAVYFKAKWKTEFKKKDTKPIKFKLDDGTEKEVETMIGEVDLSYYNDEKFSVIKLPYGYGKFYLFIYLPEEGYTTNDIVSEIGNINFDKSELKNSSKRDLYLPKFEFSYENKLNNELATMGMTDAFDPIIANFSSISDQEIFISEVKHKTYIKTDEEGTEAAAATSITFGDTSVGPEGIIKIDRSFLFAIVEEDTHSILFIGKVFDPTKN